MEKSFFIDTTLCTACRACQVACKQWHDLPAEKTKNNGTFQNPPDLSFNTYKLVRMKEEIIDNKLSWLFFPSSAGTVLRPHVLKLRKTRKPFTEILLQAPSSLRQRPEILISMILLTPAL